MKNVYIVEHSYELENCEEIKLIGAFSTEDEAKKIVNKYQKLLGFKDYPDNFFINKYQVDIAEWSEGFITVD